MEGPSSHRSPQPHHTAPGSPRPDSGPLAQGPEAAPPPQFLSAIRFKTILQVFVFAVFAMVAVNLLALLILVIPNLLLASAIAVFLGSLAATALTLRIFSQQPVVAIGLHWNPIAARNLGLGLLLGLASGAVAALAPVAAGFAHWEVTNQPFSLDSLVVFLVLILLSAIGEEVLFRGLPLQRINETFGPVPAVLVTSLFFGWVHSSNLSVNWVALANTVLWGIVLAVAWIKSRDLWLPIGLHTGWNWVLPLLGVELSGFTLEVTGYRLVGSNPLWDGGNYGPEAGAVTTILAPLLMLLIWKSPIRRSA